MMSGIKDNENTEIPTLLEFLPAISTDPDRRTAFTSVGKHNIRFRVDNDVVPVQDFRLDRAP